MDELLLNFLGREREKTVRIGERTCAMRLLSARETLSLRREIAQLDCADEEERALRANAALEAHHSAQRTISGNRRRSMGHPDRRGMPAIVR